MNVHRQLWNRFVPLSTTGLRITTHTQRHILYPTRRTNLQPRLTVGERVSPTPPPPQHPPPSPVATCRWETKPRRPRAALAWFQASCFLHPNHVPRRLFRAPLRALHVILELHRFDVRDERLPHLLLLLCRFHLRPATARGHPPKSANKIGLYATGTR